MKRFYFTLTAICLLMMAINYGCSRQDSEVPKKIEVTDADLFVSSEEHQIFNRMLRQITEKYETVYEALDEEEKGEVDALFSDLLEKSGTEEAENIRRKIDAILGYNYFGQSSEVNRYFNEICEPYNFTQIELIYALQKYGAANSTKTRGKTLAEALEELDDWYDACLQTCEDAYKSAMKGCSGKEDPERTFCEKDAFDMYDACKKGCTILKKKKQDEIREQFGNYA